MKILSKKQICLLHTQLIEETGGTDGIRDAGLQDELSDTFLKTAAGKFSQEQLLHWIIVHEF